MLLLLSALVENGAGTGWTVYDMLLLTIILIVWIMSLIIPLDAGNSSTLYRNRLLVLINSAVIMSITRGLSAWVTLNNLVLHNHLSTQISNSSETTRGIFQGKGSKQTQSEFQQWLVGVTDGDGTFHFSCSKDGKWVLYFKIAQSTYNLRLLYYIKSQLGVGQVSVSGISGEFRIRDKKNIIQYILPIYDKYPLLTSKQFNYNLFKQAAIIMTNDSLTKLEKDTLLNELKNQQMPDRYISSAWITQVNVKYLTRDAAITVISKFWLIGFTEAEGSFYLYKKNEGRIVHAFELTQKTEDRIVLEGIALVLNATLVTKKTYISVKAESNASIPHIIKYFNNTMKGMKSLEYRIWARSFNKQCTGVKRYEYLLKVQDQMRNIRSIRLNKNFKIVSYAQNRFSNR